MWAWTPSWAPIGDLRVSLCLSFPAPDWRLRAGVRAVGGGKGLGAAVPAEPPSPQVHLQTQQEVRLRMTGMALRVVRSDGVLALYNGLSASLCRQVPRAAPPGTLGGQGALLSELAQDLRRDGETEPREGNPDTARPGSSISSLTRRARRLLAC